MEIIKADGGQTFKTTNYEAAEFINGLFSGETSLEDAENLNEEAKDTVEKYLEWNQLYKDKYNDDPKYYLKNDLEQYYKANGEGYNTFDEFVEDMFKEVN